MLDRIYRAWSCGKAADPVERLPVTIDYRPIRNQVLSLIEEHATTNQLGLQHDGSPDRWTCATGRLKQDANDFQYDQWQSELIGTPIHEFFSQMPLRLARIRIMRMTPMTTYSLHSDQTPRLHLPIVTNLGALIMFPSRNICVNLTENHLYMVNTVLPHTAVNASSTEDRIHIIASIID